MEKNTVKQLKQLAKEQGIKGYYRMKKAQLIEALGNIDTTAPRPTPQMNRYLRLIKQKIISITVFMESINIIVRIVWDLEYALII